MEENVAEPLDQSFKPEKSILLSEEAQSYLQIAAKWAKFLSIVGFIGCGFMVLIGIFAGSFIAAISKVSPNAVPGSIGAFMGIFYIIIAAIAFMPCLYLYQFSKNAKSGILFLNTENINRSMSKLKSFFKFYGIMMIVILSLYLLIFVAAIAGADAYSAFR